MLFSKQSKASVPESMQPVNTEGELGREETKQQLMELRYRVEKIQVAYHQQS